MMLTEFDNGTNTYRIQTMDPHDRLSLSLAPNQTSIIPYNLSVNKTGYNRVEFLLFDENIPGFETVAGDRINASYRNLHLWLDVWEGQDLENEVDITG
jgi:cAMP phosphodiesterase